VLDSRQLFGREKEVFIEHSGVRYRLRVTRRGRLILTK
jgi:hemin uptake protein HemP